MTNILLCGPPLSGKTFFALLAAEELGWSFVDTDRKVEELYRVETGVNLSCREIFCRAGEKSFRELEHRVLHPLLECQEHLIALGGGVLTFSPNLALLKKMGRLIYLKEQADILVQRLLKKTFIPAYLDLEAPIESFQALIERRGPLYEMWCDHVVETHGLTIEEVTQAILSYCILTS